MKYTEARAYSVRARAHRKIILRCLDNDARFIVDFSEYRQHRFTMAASLERIKIRMNKTGMWVNDILKTSWSDVADFETPTNGLIFDVGNNNWTGKKAIMRLYSYTDGDAQQLVPCLDTNGTPCMFDFVSQKSFYNVGTGSFTWG